VFGTTPVTPKPTSGLAPGRSSPRDHKEDFGAISPPNVEECLLRLKPLADNTLQRSGSEDRAEFLSFRTTFWRDSDISGNTKSLGRHARRESHAHPPHNAYEELDAGGSVSLRRGSVRLLLGEASIPLLISLVTWC